MPLRLKGALAKSSDLNPGLLVTLDLLKRLKGCPHVVQGAYSLMCDRGLPGEYL